MTGISLGDFLSFQGEVGCWHDVQDIPDDFVAAMRSVPGNLAMYADYVTPLVLGKTWVFDLLNHHQPRTAAILLDGGELFLRWAASESGSVNLDLGLVVLGKVVLLERRRNFLNLSDENCLVSATDRVFSLPEQIKEAYYTRFDGLNIPQTGSVGYKTYQLPFPVGRPWQSWDGYLEEFSGYKKKYCAWLEGRIPDVAPLKKTASWNNFMAFLDTRPTLSGKEGDVLFVKNHIQDGVVYWVCDADIENMRVLADPVAALDLYCEHVLLGRDGRFDFMPYSAPM